MNSKKEVITFIKFTLVGLLGAGVGAFIIDRTTGVFPIEPHPLDYVIYYIIPYILSVEAGILVTFFPNDMWVFKGQEYKLTIWQRLIAYHGALFSGFLVQTVIFIFFLIIHTPIRIAYFLGIGGAALWNYVVSRKTVFAEEMDSVSDGVVKGVNKKVEWLCLLKKG